MNMWLISGQRMKAVVSEKYVQPAYMLAVAKLSVFGDNCKRHAVCSGVPFHSSPFRYTEKLKFATTIADSLFGLRSSIVAIP